MEIDMEKVKKNMRSLMAQRYPGPNPVKETLEQKQERERVAVKKNYSNILLGARKKLRAFRESEGGSE